MNALELFIEKHIHDEPKSMNVEFAKLAREAGINLVIGNNDPFGIAPIECQEQAVQVSEDFIRTLELLDTHMEPSLEELNTVLTGEEGDESFHRTVHLISGDKCYEGRVYLGILSQYCTFWINTTELKEI